MLAHGKVRNVWLPVIGLSLLVQAYAQEPQLEEMVQAIENHNNRVTAISSGLDKNISAEDLAPLWQECSQMRDLRGARKLADSKALDAKPFWKGCFAILAGEKMDRLIILQRAEAKDVSIESGRQVVRFLFSQDEMESSKVPALEPLRSELADALQSAAQKGGSLPNVDGALTLKHFDGELFKRLIAEPRKKLSRSLLESLALSAFASCHYQEAMELYDTVREEIRLLPKQYRDVLGCGMNMFYLAYSAQSPVASAGEDGWLQADGIDVQVDPKASGVRWKLSMIEAKRRLENRSTKN